MYPLPARGMVLGPGSQRVLEDNSARRAFAITNVSPVDTDIYLSFFDPAVEFRGLVLLVGDVFTPETDDPLNRCGLWATGEGGRLAIQEFV